MNKLTCKGIVDKWYLKECGECDGNCEKCKHLDKAIEKLAEYEQAEEDGLLVKVIRCKDCKFFSGGGLWSKGHWCGRTARPGDCVHVTENDFCSMAEQALGSSNT